MVDWFRLGYAVAYITFAVGIVSSLARFYSRALVVRLWGRDDTASCLVFVRRCFTPPRRRPVLI
jgi:hypothetical protein